MFPNPSSRVKELKTTEGGAVVLCEVMEKYMAESRAEGRLEGRLEQLIDLVRNNLLSIANAALTAGMSEEEFEKLLQ